MTVDEESFSKIKVEEPVQIEENSFQGKPNRRHSRPWLIPLFLGTGLGIAIAFVSVNVLGSFSSRQQKAVGDTTQPAKAVMTVTTATVERTRVARTLNATGSIAARDLIPVLAQTNGLQIKVIPADVKEGTFVRLGQVLAILDDSILQAQISQAKADIESQQATLESRRADLTSQQANVASSQAIVQQRRADLAQSQARLEEAEKNFQRYEQLATAGAISEQELDTRSYTVRTATETVRVSQENIRSAQANVSSAQANVSKAQADINKAQADVRSMSAKLRQLQAQLQQTVVRSPVAGIIAEKLARIGDITGVTPQTQVGTVIGGTQKLFSIIRDGRLELQAQIPEIQLSQVKVGASVEVLSDMNSNLRLQGRVREIQPQVNDQRREATVKIDLPPTNLFKPGMFARGEITTTTDMGLAVPQKAVQSQPDGSVIVFTLSGEDIVRSQAVEVGEIIDNNRVEIKSGLELDNRVIVDGAGYLKDGDRVRISQ